MGGGVEGAARCIRRGLPALVIAVALTLSPAARAQPGQVLTPVPAAELPTLLDDDGVQSLRDALRQSLGWLERRGNGRLVFGPRAVTVAEQARVFRRLLQALADDPRPEVLEARILAEFDVLRSTGRDDGAVLVTAYHEPVIDAAEMPGGEYRVPILGVPPDLFEYERDGRPYWSRGDIESGRVARLGRPLAWARDPIDVFFMEVEGSGTLRFPDGREIRVGHAATNRRPYRSIGRLLIDEGKIDSEAMTMQTLREWLVANPAERVRILRHNESYVFFRRLPGSPVGSLGVPLTAGRSVAVDPRVFPAAALAFLRTERPRRLPDGGVGWETLSRFVLSQDAGGAIRGPGRVDLFWGRGPEADLAASDMKQLGELYFLAPKSGGNARPR